MHVTTVAGSGIEGGGGGAGKGDGGSRFHTTSLYVEDSAADLAAFEAAVLKGLADPKRNIPQDYCYDDTGSDVFFEMTKQPYYYLTRAEDEVLATHGRAILQAAGVDGSITSSGRRVNLIELGSGDGTKSVTLLTGLAEAAVPVDNVTFVPVDVSRGAMRRLYGTLDGKPGPPGTVPVHGYVADYFQALDALRDADWVPGCEPVTQNGFKDGFTPPRPHNVLAFLGSTVGNNLGDAFPRFLSTLRSRLEPGDALILGTDTLASSPSTHLSVYPSEGLLTDLFHGALVDRMRRELAATVEEGALLYKTEWDTDTEAITGYLVANRDTVVRVGRGEGDTNGETVVSSGAPPKDFALSKGDRIRVLVTRKFAAKTVAEGAAAAGFEVVGTWTDSKRRFADTVMRAV